MSINCLSSVQCIINKKQGAAPLTEINLTSAINPMPYNPDAYFSAQSAIVRNSANNQVTSCSCKITASTVMQWAAVQLGTKYGRSPFIYAARTMETIGQQ